MAVKTGRVLVGAIALATVIAGVGAQRGLGQATLPPALANAKAQDRISGADNCIRCHKEPLPADKQPGGATEFLRMDESSIWDTDDLHKRAFDALKSPLGQQMGRILKTDVTRDPRCLTCHAVDLMPEKKLADKAADDFYTPFGVGCEACHGFSREWLRSHAIRNSWREKDPQDKEKDGLWDMRNPVRRAERCASCHVGSETDGRFVTHEMYAAGHPPLPSLEVMSFSRDQRMHYNLSRDLPYLVDLARKDPEKSWRLFHFRGDDVESQVTRQLAVGAIMALKANAKLLADKANSIDPAKDALDLAHFDCYGCHHDLQSDGWRRARGFIGIPGRPQIRPGVALLAKIVAEHAATARNAGEFIALRQFPDKFRTLTAAFDARPFGAPGDVAAAANGIVNWCDAVLKELDEVRYNKAETARLLKMIVAAGQRPPKDQPNPWVDADAAQQLVWAAGALLPEIADLAAGQRATAVLKSFENLKPQVRETGNNDLLAPQLGDRLHRLYRFEPDHLYDKFAELAAILGGTS